MAEDLLLIFGFASLYFSSYSKFAWCFTVACLKLNSSPLYQCYGLVQTVEFFLFSSSSIVPATIVCFPYCPFYRTSSLAMAMLAAGHRYGKSPLQRASCYTVTDCRLRWLLATDMVSLLFNWLLYGDRLSVEIASLEIVLFFYALPVARPTNTLLSF